MTNDDRPSKASEDDESDPAAPPVGTLVIRTWNEPDQEPGFRARITFSQAPGVEPSSVGSADPDEVLSIVRRWLASKPVPPSEQ